MLSIRNSYFECQTNMIHNIKIKELESGHKTTVEPFILADFVKLKDKMNIIDLGCGNGILSILLAMKKNVQVIGIDIQDDYIKLAKENIQLNRQFIKGEVQISKIDIKEASKKLPKNHFDVIVTNPPFYKCNQGKKSTQMNRSISRHELFCTFEDIVREASRLLKNLGTLYFLHIPKRIGEIFETLKRYKLAVKEMQIIYPRIESNATHIIIKATKNAKPATIILKPLIINECERNTNSPK